MLYIERKPSLPLQRLVQSLWYAKAPRVEGRRERILPSGCAHVVLTLSRNFLTECVENHPDQRTAPALFVGQRSQYEIVSSADLVDLAGIQFHPGAVPALIADRADLLSNRNLALDQVWMGCTDRWRQRMIEVSSPQARLGILDHCLLDLLQNRPAHPDPHLHPSVQFALAQFRRPSCRTSIAEIALQSGWSERRLSQLFREQIGFSPKAWYRLQRFQHAARRLHSPQSIPWAELAIECGFYDQAHFANEFRAFSGMDLTTYQAAAPNELIPHDEHA